ncbi:MAG TPA: recombinase family protein [Candidatus Limiplasma sp.]|nr:recombinase family protein [Candidatus Limiplasma sp.]
MEAKRKVTKIERGVSTQSPRVHGLPAKRRVAAYARVSTDSDEQFTSFSAQVDYYTRQIESNPAWEMAKVYTDEGISGTNTKKREGFNSMIADALAGKFDLIITKSISRFARNTVDTLTAVRRLKEKGVEVYFEKENIYTMDSKGELLITIMSSLAQEESRSISENVAWGKRAKCEEGKVYLPYKQFLGYERSPGEDGRPQIVESQAATVRLIYSLFLEGLMPSGVAKELERRGILSPAGKEHWQPSTVKSILTNEKYKGDALLQKTYCVDFLTKRMKRNEGELPQYYVQESHPAIIAPEVFDEVQYELKRRLEARYTGKSGCFSSRIICGECGAYFGRKVWHSTDAYRTVIWRCQHKYENDAPCKTPHVTEDQIKAAFTAAMNRAVDNKAEIMSALRALAGQLTDTSALDAEEKTLVDECEVLSGLMRRLISDNATTAQDVDAFNRRVNELQERAANASARLEEISQLRQERRARKKGLDAFLHWLKDAEQLTEFDEGLWNAVVESAIVQTDGDLVFRLKDGTEIE